MLELGAGWYSAMAQGQAMSLLVRATHHSGDSRYLKAAIRATALFSVNATHGKELPSLYYALLLMLAKFNKNPHYVNNKVSLI